jgi:RimJ/RimL family protein N-acetyltransferase
MTPRIPTERLLLRELRAADFDAYATHMADPIATEFLTKIPDRRTAWRSFCALSGTWPLLGAGWWAVDLRSSGECLGIVGAFFRETQLHLLPAADLEIGWSVFREHWRNGYAKEASAAALAWGLDRFRPPRAIAYIDPANLASVKTSAALGMTFDAEVDFYGERIHRYAVVPRVNDGPGPHV